MLLQYLLPLGVTLSARNEVQDDSRPSSAVSADLGFNLGPRGDRPATNRSNPVTANETDHLHCIP